MIASSPPPSIHGPLSSAHVVGGEGSVGIDASSPLSLFFLKKKMHMGTQPPTVVQYAKRKLSWNIHTCCIHVFARLASIYKLSRCILTKVSASELSRRLIQSALLVGQCGRHTDAPLSHPPPPPPPLHFGQEVSCKHIREPLELTPPLPILQLRE